MRYFLIAGEASGDLHASNLMRALKANDSEAEFSFLGGDLMQAVGGKMIRHYRDMAFMGFVTVLRNLRTVLKNMSDSKDAIVAFKPDVVILVDYPSFNLRIAKFVKEQLHLPVIYYIAPKLWAWKEYRIKSIKRYVDKVLTIFPFETEFYRNHNYEVKYVGNPTVDSVAEILNREEVFSDFCTENNLQDKPIIALLAGSRRQEISKCLPVMLESVKQFIPDYQIVISGAPGIETDFYREFSPNADIPVVFNKTYPLVYHAKAAIVNSGTATLETALIGTPQVVVYYVQPGRLMYILKKIFLKVKYISLVNLISEKETVRELIAHLFTPEQVSAETDRILHNKEYLEQMLADYRNIQLKLGKPGTARNAAIYIIDFLKKQKT